MDLKAEGDEIPLTPATLSQFKEAIDKYENLLGQVEKLDEEIIIDKWFRLNVRLFKQSLYDTVEHWSLMFKQHLIDSYLHLNAASEEYQELSSYNLDKVCEYIETIEGGNKFKDYVFDYFRNAIPADFHDLLTNYAWRKYTLLMWMIL